jgi:hypothetical protein
VVTKEQGTYLRVALNGVSFCDTFDLEFHLGCC